MNDGDAVNLAMLIMRLGFGLMMVAHGYSHFFQGGRIAGTGRWFDSLGMKPGRIHAIVASVTEIGAGALFAVGLLTPFAAAGFIGLMTVAIWTVHRKNGFFIIKEGWEYTFLIAVVALFVATLGCSAWAPATRCSRSATGPRRSRSPQVTGVAAGTPERSCPTP